MYVLLCAFVNKRVCVDVLQYFADLRNSIVNSQPPEKQQAMHLCFENLMEGIERNLLTKNRDRYVKITFVDVKSDIVIIMDTDGRWAFSSGPGLKHICFIT